MCTVETVINKTSLHTEIFGVFLDILAMYTNVTKEDDICSFIELQKLFYYAFVCQNIMLYTLNIYNINKFKYY